MNEIDDSRRSHMMARVRGYFDACNTASRRRFAEVLAEDCVHYFPPEAGGPYHGRDAIADLWIGFVRNKGSAWTIDRMVCDGEEIVVEWTHWKPKVGEHIRGSEWYGFDRAGRIDAIWAHYASPRDAARPANELEGFAYRERGYAIRPPTLPDPVLEERRQALLEEAERGR